MTGPENDVYPRFAWRQLADRALRRFGYWRIDPRDDAAVKALLWERNVARAASRWAKAERDVDPEEWAAAMNRFTDGVKYE